MDLNKWRDFAHGIAYTVDRNRAHISLVLKKNRLVAVGTNEFKTHPMTQQYGYILPYMHSELDAYRKIKRVGHTGLTLLNFRFSKTGQLGMARPCKYCTPWCVHTFDNIIYSDEKGVMREFNVQDSLPSVQG